MAGLTRRVHQTSPTTRLDRYPAVFAHVQQLCAANASPHILSFGCSTGEEAISLRTYFPGATIVGADVNRYSLRVARRQAAGTGAKFILSTELAVKDNGPYDIIFCMAVLERAPEQVRNHNIQDISALYPFSKFEEQLAALDRSLRPGGLMVVKFAQYLLEDTVLADRYEPASDGPIERQDMIRFHPSGLRKAPGRGPVIFRKIR